MDVEQLFSFIRDMYSEKEEVKLKFRYEQGSVWAELNLIKTVLLNLVDNACKASDPGGTIEISGKRLEEGYLFKVKDHGTGIPEEECKKIMEAFYMVDKSRSRKEGGAGIGMALCQKIINLHGAVMQIVSKVSEGTAIGITFPLEPLKKEGAVESDEK